NRLDDIALRLRQRIERLEFPERVSSEHRTGPGAKILGSKVLARDLMQVSVDVGGLDRLSLTLVVDVLEELFTRQVLAPFHNPRQPTIVEIYRVFNPTLAAKLETERPASNMCMPVAHGSQSE